MTFTYSEAPQRSPEWFKLRMGKITASRLDDWLGVSKAKGKEGQPLQKRLDYEKELMFERQFGVNYQNFMSDAMQDGVDYEDFARKQYEQTKGVVALECGCWHNGWFVASPDRLVGDDGLIEVKILRDNSFTEVLLSGVPSKHWYQIQGQLMATGRTWCDYVAANLNARKMAIIRVEADPEFHKELELALQQVLNVLPFTTDSLYDLTGEIPSRAEIGLGLAAGNYEIGGTDKW